MNLFEENYIVQTIGYKANSEPMAKTKDYKYLLDIEGNTYSQ